MLKRQQQLRGLMGNLHPRELSKSYLGCEIFGVCITTIHCIDYLLSHLWQEIVVLYIKCWPWSHLSDAQSLNKKYYIRKGFEGNQVEINFG